ncbi:MAG TPA: acetyl-CoA hydrolase/transferase C-terminal domain-containing protein [Syntrophomonadaceae bacterium]|nr:acetyl-CoA hydrolase/transferase C-terminal domain-containing protein [Syntrophomonadaceae bacterium]
MFEREYQEKLRTPEEAVKVVKSGDWVDYMYFNGYPKALDKALAKRRDELTGVHIRSGISLPPMPEVPLSDPTMEHFQWDSWHYSAFDAKLADQGICSYSPLLYHEVPGYYRNREVEVDVAMLRVCPMDRFGYFNFGINASHCEAVIENARIAIVEENESMPYVYGGNGNQIHISEIDMIVRGENEPMANAPLLEATEAEKRIAEHLLEDIHDGCCIQLGIGGLPNYLGKQIAAAGLKDLGVHTEMMADAYVEMWEKGCITGAKKELDRKKMVCAFALGSPHLYEFMDHNPMIACYSVDYTNNPYVIAQISNMISINACLEVDFYGQVVSEMQGPRQITGTGGQWDFVYGAYHSKGGKSFLCMPSTFKAKDGSLQSKIRPLLTPGAACTVSRQLSHYIVTEYGKALMKCQSIWVRTENLINIAHPDFRDELIAEANKMGFWKRTNKIAP